MKLYAAAALLVLTGGALSAQPAWSQGVMGGAPGGAALAPQPRMAPPPPAPQAPAFIPSAPPMAPGVNVITSKPNLDELGGSGGSGAGKASASDLKTQGSAKNGNGVAATNTYTGSTSVSAGLNATNVNTGSGGAAAEHRDPSGVVGCLPDKCAMVGKTGSVGLKQAPSKAPLPSGYVYDANGRIVMAGKTGSAPAKQEETVVVTAERKAEDSKVRQAPSRAPLPAGYAYDANNRIAYVGTDANGKTGPLPSGPIYDWNLGSPLRTK